MSDQDTSERRGLAAFNGWWAAAGCLIVLVVLGVAYVIIWGGPTTTPARAAAPVTASTGAASSSDSIGQVPPDDQEVLSSAPETAWDSFHGISLPVSATAGPRTQKGPLWSGYTHTATGSLFAATYLLLGTDGPEAAAVMSAQSIDGPVARAYIAKVTASPKAVEPGRTPDIAGFRFVSYTSTAARIELLAVAPNLTASILVDVVWQDGDWKINFEPAGQQPHAVEIGGPSGFIPWSAK